MIGWALLLSIAASPVSTSTAGVEVAACRSAPIGCRDAFESVRAERTRCAVAAKAVIDILRVDLGACEARLAARDPKVIETLIPPCPACGPERSQGALWGAGVLGVGVGGGAATIAFCDGWQCRAIGLTSASVSVAVGAALLWLFDE